MMWSKSLELIYRAYARATQDVTLDMHLVEQKLKDVFEGDVTFAMEDKIYFPIRAEDVPKFENKGYLVTEMSGEKCVLIYGTKATIITKDDPHLSLNLARGACGDVFASIEVIERALTDIIAQ